MSGTAAGVAFTRTLANGIRWLVSGSALWFAPTFTASDGTTIDVGPLVQAGDGGNPSGWGISLSGTSVVFAAGIVGSSSSVPTVGRYFGMSLSGLGLFFPATPYRLVYRTTITGVTGTRGGASPTMAMFTSVGGYASLQRGVGFNLSTTGFNFNPAWLTSTSGGLFANVSGSATCLGVVGSCWQLVSYTQENKVHKIEGGIPTSEYSGSNGNATTSQFTHAALWMGVGSGTLTNQLSFDGVSGTIRWLAT